MLRHLRLSTGSLSCNDQCGTAAMTRLLGAEGVKAKKVSGTNVTAQGIAVKEQK
jgi:hypothetical protein